MYLLLTLSAAAWGGCRCGKRELPTDLLELLPEQAVFVISLDLARLRRAPAMASLTRRRKRGADSRRALGFDPTRDLQRVVVAAAGRGRELDYLILMLGRFSREEVVQALKRRSGSPLARIRRRGYTIYRERSGLGPRLLFPGRRTVAVVSPGWEELLVRRLSGLGRTVFEANPPLGADIKTVRATRSTWLVSRLSSGTASYLAERVGWPELRRLGGLQGGLTAGERVELDLVLAMEQEAAARSLELRLVNVARKAATAGRRLDVARRGSLGVRIRLSLGRGEIERLLEQLRRPRRPPGG